MRSQDFWGFVRADGRVGTRNLVVVVALEALSAPLAQRIGRCLPRVVTMVLPTGRGQVGVDTATARDVVVGLASNPNVAGAVLVANDDSFFESIAPAIASVGVDVETLAVGRYGSTLDATAVGIRAAAAMILRASDARAQPAPIAKLRVALKCGLSDSTSGLVANRVAGAVVDRLVDAGATVVFGETAELTGAETVLAGRASTREVARKLEAAIQHRLEQAGEFGGELAQGVLGPENRRGGLTTVEEKALGNVVKTGTRRIQGLIHYGESPPNPGLWMMDTPVFAPEAVTGMVAGGSTVVLFTTGAGNPYGHPLAPTLKLGGNPRAHPMVKDHLDLDMSAHLRGRIPLESAADEALAILLRVASGRLTCAEVLEEESFAIARQGPSI